MVVPQEKISDYSPSIDQILEREQKRKRGIGYILKQGFGLILILALFIASWYTAEVSPQIFWEGLPRLGSWVERMFPPDFSEFPTFLIATWETLAIAIVGTGIAIIIALPLALITARNLTPFPQIAFILRMILNLLRGIDTAIFALFFVSVVGLGPFAGVLGVAFHTTGSMTKLYTEALETIPMKPIEAIKATGADSMRIFAFAVLPEALPGLTSISLYLWEFNVRSSVILGIVGAGGIGYELLVSLKLLDFGRLSTILILILLMVSLIDGASAYLRKQLS